MFVPGRSSFEDWRSRGLGLGGEERWNWSTEREGANGVKNRQGRDEDGVGM